MRQQVPDESNPLWRRLVRAHQTVPYDRAAFQAAVEAFLQPGVDRVALIRTAARGRDMVTALYAATRLRTDELLELFPELVYWASWGHGATGTIQDLILALPRDWVLQRIEAAAAPLLKSGTDDEYYQLLGLYHRLGFRDLTVGLARRAAGQADVNIREAGEEFLRLLEGP